MLRLTSSIRRNLSAVWALTSGEGYGAQASRKGRMPNPTDDRVTIHITWWKLLTLAVAIVAPVAVTVAGGYWLLIDKVIDGVKASVAELRLDTGDRFASREEEDRDVRRHVQESADKLRAEVAALRQELGTLGDRIVASNEDVGKTIEGLHGKLIAVIENSDGRAGQRFDRLEQKVDQLIRDIAFPIEKNAWPGPRLSPSSESVKEPR
jgi:hypothetical protein